MNPLDAIDGRVLTLLLAPLAGLPLEEQAARLAAFARHLGRMAANLEALVAAQGLEPGPFGSGEILVGGAFPVGEDPLALGLELDDPLPTGDGWAADPAGAPYEGVDAYVADPALLATYRHFFAESVPKFAGMRRTCADLREFVERFAGPFLDGSIEDVATLDDPYQAETLVAVNQRAILQATALAAAEDD